MKIGLALGVVSAAVAVSSPARGQTVGPVEDVPTIGTQTVIGSGSHPSIGSNGTDTFITYRDASTGKYIVRNATGTIVTPSNMNGSQCVMGAAIQFCQLQSHFNGDGDPADGFRSYEFGLSTGQTKTREYSLGELGVGTIRGVSGRSVVIEKADHSVELLTRSPTSLTAINVATTDPSLDRQPRVFGDDVVFVDTMSGATVLKMRRNGHDMSAYKTNGWPTILEMDYTGVLFRETGTPGLQRWLPGGPNDGEGGGGWDDPLRNPGTVVPVTDITAAALGCTGLARIRNDYGAQLVEGTNCSGMSHALFLLGHSAWGTQPFLVGELSGTGEFSHEGGTIVYADGAGDIVQLTLDRDQLVFSAWEVEPNNSESSGKTLSPWHVGADGTGEINIGTDTADYWNLNLLAGITYDIQVVTGWCSDPNYDSRFQLAADGITYYVDNNEIPGSSEDPGCAGFQFTPAASGAYRVRVEGGVLGYGMGYNLRVRPN